MRVAALLLLAALAHAQDIPRMDTWRKAWVASTVALGATQVADVATSYGRVGRESNPLFGDTFTAKDAAIKAGVVAGMVTAQYIVIRRYPNSKAAKVFAFVNFGAAGATGAVAWRNAR